MIVGIVFETISTATAIRKEEVATRATRTANVAILKSPTSVESQPKVRSGVISALDALPNQSFGNAHSLCLPPMEPHRPFSQPSFQVLQDPVSVGVSHVDGVPLVAPTTLAL